MSQLWQFGLSNANAVPFELSNESEVDFKELHLGYTPDHPASTYCMYDHDTNGIHNTRDVT
jgi:hypothetical protein